jgi:hypothetical protein
MCFPNELAHLPYLQEELAQIHQTEAENVQDVVEPSAPKKNTTTKKKADVKMMTDEQRKLMFKMWSDVVAFT